MAGTAIGGDDAMADQANKIKRKAKPLPEGLKKLTEAVPSGRS
jgi:hypothetical protein